MRFAAFSSAPIASSRNDLIKGARIWPSSTCSRSPVETLRSAWQLDRRCAPCPLTQSKNAVPAASNWRAVHRRSRRQNSLLFAHFERPDLKKAETYLRDFGLVPVAKTGTELFLRGTGSHPYIYRVTLGQKARFLGFGLSVPRAEDLERLSRAFGARIEQADGPGGGSVVHLRDPEGIAVDVLHCFAPSAPLPVRAAIPHNAPNQIVRINDTQRPKLEPPQVTKLGHLVLEAVSFDTSARWYMDSLGFIPSDVMCLPDGTPVGAFMRLDRGEEPTDHHTLFVAPGA